MKDYYAEIDRRLHDLELGRYTEYTAPSIASWVADRISWAWKFRKITEKQMHELTERMITYFEMEVL